MPAKRPTIIFPKRPTTTARRADPRPAAGRTTTATPARATTTVGHRSAKIFEIQNLSHSMGFGPNRWFWSLPSTQKPKNYAANEVLALLFSPRKNIFFLRKSFFRNIFDIFRLFKSRIFAIWATR